MPVRSKIISLPDEVRAELDNRLITTGFSGYSALESWLADLGYEISRSAVHRYAQGFESKVAAIKVATEQAKAIATAVGDDEGAMNEALIRLVQQQAFDVLVNMQTEDPELYAKMFPKMGVMVARLSRAAVGQKKWQAEARQKANRAVENIEQKARKKSLDPETLKLIKEEIYGIV